MSDVFRATCLAVVIGVLSLLFGILFALMVRPEDMSAVETVGRAFSVAWGMAVIGAGFAYIIGRDR